MVESLPAETTLPGAVLVGLYVSWELLFSFRRERGKLSFLLICRLHPYSPLTGSPVGFHL